MYGIVINTVGFVGVGAIVSLVVGGIRLNSERKRQRLEEVRRLNPTFYQPLYEWSQGQLTQGQLTSLNSPEDVFFSDHYPNNYLKLNLETNIVYQTLKNSDLKKAIETARSKQRSLVSLQESIVREYNSRVKSKIDDLIPNLGYEMIEGEPRRKISQSDFDRMLLSIADGQFVISALVSHYKFTEFVRQVNNSSYHFLLSGAFPGGTLKCPPEVLLVITKVDDLPSYNDYVSTFNEYKDALVKVKNEIEKSQRG